MQPGGTHTPSYGCIASSRSCICPSSFVAPGRVFARRTRCSPHRAQALWPSAESIIGLPCAAGAPLWQQGGRTLTPARRGRAASRSHARCDHKVVPDGGSCDLRAWPPSGSADARTRTREAPLPSPPTTVVSPTYLGGVSHLTRPLRCPRGLSLPSRGDRPPATPPLPLLPIAPPSSRAPCTGGLYSAL